MQVNTVISRANIKDNNINHLNRILYSHENYLDGLRAVSAVYVVFHHAIMHTDPNANIWTYLLSKPFVYGHYAVCLFIVLSGFCLMLPAARNNGHLRIGTTRFLYGRAKRILPPYYLSMLLSLLLIATIIGDQTTTHWNVSIPITSWDIFTHMVLIQDIFRETSPKINHVFWSISVEWRIYFLFPLLLICLRKWGVIKLTVSVTTLAILLWIVLWPTSLNLNPAGINPHFILLFLFGAIAAQISHSDKDFYIRLKNSLPLNRIIVFVAIAFLLVKGISFTVIGSKEYLWIIEDVLVGLAALVLLIGLSTRRFNNTHRFLSWRPLCFIGTFAYSLYLIHAPILQIITIYILEPLNTTPFYELLILYSVGVASIIIVSYLFYLIAEKPFINKKVRK